MNVELDSYMYLKIDLFCIRKEPGHTVDAVGSMPPFVETLGL